MPEPTPIPLNRATESELDHLVQRVARKSGHAGGPTYREHLQRKMEAKLAKSRRKIEDKTQKLGLRRASTDFTEEIRAYLADGIRELMAEGHSEAEALRLTLAKFDEAELAESFDAFMDAFDDFGLTAVMEQAKRDSAVFYAEQGEAVGLFYAGFVFLGLTGGSLIGWLTSHNWLGLGIGAGAGLGFGIAGGLFAHAIFAAIRRR